MTLILQGSVDTAVIATGVRRLLVAVTDGQFTQRNAVDLHIPDWFIGLDVDEALLDDFV